MGIEDLFLRYEKRPCASRKTPVRLPNLERCCQKAGCWDARGQTATVRVQYAAEEKDPLAVAYVFRRNGRRPPHLLDAAVYLDNKPLRIDVSRSGSLWMVMHPRTGGGIRFGTLGNGEQRLTVDPQKIRAGLEVQQQYDFNATQPMLRELRQRFNLPLKNGAADKRGGCVDLQAQSVDVLAGHVFENGRQRSGAMACAPAAVEMTVRTDDGAAAPCDLVNTALEI